MKSYRVNWDFGCFANFGSLKAARNAVHQRAQGSADIYPSGPRRSWTKPLERIERSEAPGPIGGLK